jgi:hypothetical protein
MLTFFLIYAGVAFLLVTATTLHWLYRTIRPGKHPLSKGSYLAVQVLFLAWPLTVIVAILFGCFYVFSKVQKLFRR